MGSSENITLAHTITSHIEEIVDYIRAHTEEVKEDLANNYYDRTTIQSLFASGLKTSIVDELPEEGTSGIIYFVPVANEDTNLEADTNIYKEYMWINSSLDDTENYVWEAIGSTELTLSDYYTKTELTELLEAKLDTTEVPTALSELDNDINALKILYVSSLPDTGEENTIYIVPSDTTYTEDNICNEYIYVNGAWEAIAPADIVYKAELNNYYLKEETYSKEEVDTALDDLEVYIGEDGLLTELGGSVDIACVLQEVTGDVTISCNYISSDTISDEAGTWSNEVDTNTYDVVISDYEWYYDDNYGKGYLSSITFATALTDGSTDDDGNYTNDQELSLSVTGSATIYSYTDNTGETSETVEVANPTHSTAYDRVYKVGITFTNVAYFYTLEEALSAYGSCISIKSLTYTENSGEEEEEDSEETSEE